MLTPGCCSGAASATPRHRSSRGSNGSRQARPDTPLAPAALLRYDGARRWQAVATSEPTQPEAHQRFDSTAKMLVEADPPAWLALAGLPVDGPVRAIEAGLDTVRAQADAVL